MYPFIQPWMLHVYRAGIGLALIFAAATSIWPPAGISGLISGPKGFMFRFELWAIGEEFLMMRLWPSCMPSIRGSKMQQGWSMDTDLGNAFRAGCVGMDFVPRGSSTPVSHTSVQRIPMLPLLTTSSFFRILPFD